MSTEPIPIPKPHQGFRGTHFSQPRPRSFSAGPHFHYNSPNFQQTFLRMDSFPRLPPPMTIPQHPITGPKRTQAAGLNSQRTPPQIAQINNSDAFKVAVLNDPQGMFAQLTDLLKQNQDLELKVASITEDYSNTRRDYSSKREQYDILLAIGNAKQILLWKFIERLQGGKFEGGGLKGAKERSAAREQEAADGSVKLPKEDLTGNESPGTVASYISGTSRHDAFDSPTRSMAGSASTSFDPNAEVFVPRLACPRKYYEEPSDAPSNPNTVPVPFQIPDADIKLYVRSLPFRFIGVCPVSLTYDHPCSNATCRLNKLCERYNDQCYGKRCFDPNCSYLHELRTCSETILGFKCSHFFMGPSTLRKKEHFSRRIHPRKGSYVCEEWQARTIVAALIPAHLDGRY